MFANKSRYGTITNDLNPEFKTMFNLDALEFIKMQRDEIADVILFDPPYSLTQAAQLYKDYGKEKLDISLANMKYWADLKDECARVCRLGGIVISCGWNTNGLGSNRGFDLREVLIVAHGGGKNDTLVTVETKLTHQIDIFEILTHEQEETDNEKQDTTNQSQGGSREPL